MIKTNPNKENKNLIGVKKNQFFFSRCDNALAAMDLVRLLERPSLKAADACFATFLEVTFGMTKSLSSTTLDESATILSSFILAKRKSSTALISRLDIVHNVRIQA